MARTTVIVLEDDLDGGPAAENVVFSIDGSAFEIDLNAANADKMRQLLQPYIDAGRRRTGTGEASRRNPNTRHTTKELRRIRDWARAEGHDVSSRGRIPQAVMDAYTQAGQN